MEVMPVRREEGGSAARGGSDGGFDGDVDGRDDFKTAGGVVGGCNEARKEAVMSQVGVRRAAGCEDGDGGGAQEVAGEVMADAARRRADEDPWPGHVWFVLFFRIRGQIILVSLGTLTSLAMVGTVEVVLTVFVGKVRSR